MSAIAPLYIKEAFKDEPSFRDSKVVFSIYEDELKNKLSEDIKAKLQLKGIKKDDLKILNDASNYSDLYKLAIDYSDGIIQNSPNVNEEVMEYARQSNKLILDYQSPENYTDACNQFYDQVWEANQK